MSSFFTISFEMAIMRTHPLIGADILGHGLGDSPLLQMAAAIALAHHERYDGRGYPHGLHSEQIPQAARIVAVADVFDALTSPRPYKAAWTLERAHAFLLEHSGTHFDPACVAAFMDGWGEVLAIHQLPQIRSRLDGLPLPIVNSHHAALSRDLTDEQRSNRITRQNGVKQRPHPNVVPDERPLNECQVPAIRGVADPLAHKIAHGNSLDARATFARSGVTLNRMHADISSSFRKFWRWRIPESRNHFLDHRKDLALFAV